MTLKCNVQNEDMGILKMEIKESGNVPFQGIIILQPNSAKGFWNNNGEREARDYT